MSVVILSLTASEIRELKARAAADLRTISNYVSVLVVEELKRKGRRRSPAGARPGDKRRFYALQLYLTVSERNGWRLRRRPRGGVCRGMWGG